MTPWRTLRLLLALVILGTGCYSFAWSTVSYSTPVTWTGSGRGTFASSLWGRGVGLAGQRMILLEGSPSDGFGPIVIDDPLASHFSGASYLLRSYTQTLGAYGHQFGVLLAHLASGGANVDLFFQTGVPAAAPWYRARPSSPTFWEAPVDAITWTIVELCDVAAITDPFSTSAHRVFASVRARRCSSSCSTALRGGVVELQLEGVSGFAPSWRVVLDENGLGNAAMHDQDGNTFSDECMPIDVTTAYSDQAGQRLVVADPSDDEILMYDVSRLRSGPIDVISTPDGARSPVDIAVLADREGSADFVLVAALWRGSAAPQLRHYTGTLRTLGATAHLTESMSSDVRFIQGQLQAVTTAPALRGNLYTLGDRAIRRTYEF